MHFSVYLRTLRHSQLRSDGDGETGGCRARGVVGFKEQVTSSGPDQNGVHVNGEDPADIAWGIKETLRDPEKARNWGENGRKRVLEYFTWRKVADETLKIYESLL